MPPYDSAQNLGYTDKMHFDVEETHMTLQVNSNSQPQRKIEAHTLTSTFLSEERTLKVFVPPAYNKEKAYPIMYCHDGLEFFTHGRVATIANQMMLDGELEPMLIAGIAVSKTNRTDDY